MATMGVAFSVEGRTLIEALCRRAEYWERRALESEWRAWHRERALAAAYSEALAAQGS